MFKYYKIATIIPFIVIVVCYFLLGIIDFVFGLNISLTNKDVTPFYVLFYVPIWGFLNFVLTVPILFNNLKSKFIFAFLSWFPLSMFYYIFWFLNLSIPKYDYKEGIVVYSFTIPYFIGLSWSFILFCKEKKCAKNKH